jgi:hypothetical protein
MYQREKKQTRHKVLITTIPLGANTMIPTFLNRLEALLEIILCQHLQHLLRFGLDLLYNIKSSPLHLNFHLGKEKEEVSGG